MSDNRDNFAQTTPDIDSDIICDFAAYDRLPVDLRKALQEYNANFSSEMLLDAVRGMSRNYSSKFVIKTIMLELTRAELQEIATFARENAHKYHPPAAPHLDANVSIQRYGRVIPHPRYRNKTPGYSIRSLSK